MRPRFWFILAAGCGLAEYDVVDDRACSESIEVPVRRLTQAEYVRTVRDTLGVDITAEAKAVLPDDPKVDGFRNNAFALAVSTAHVDGYWSLALAMPERMPDWEGLLAAHAPCMDPTLACQEGFVASLGAALFRRPLESEEVASIVPVFEAADDFSAGAGLAMSTLLMSPQFLYRLEPTLGDAPATRDLDDHELASRLSYLIWGSSPDAMLIAEAQAGTLSSPEVLAAQVARMLEDRRAREYAQQYFAEWLNLDALDVMVRDPERYPEFSRALAAQMKQETLDLVDAMVWSDRPLLDLLTVEQTWVEPALAELYGLPPQSDGAYDLTGHPERYGVLTHASVLASTAHGNDASLVERGLFLLENVLCGYVEQPPVGVDTTLPDLGPGAGQRELSEVRLDSVACGGCHTQIDPLGYALERYDAIGRVQSEDPWGNPLVGDGVFRTPDGEYYPFDDVRQFVDQLAASPLVQTCMAQHHLQFALGRPIAPDDCALDELLDQLGEAPPTLPEMLTAIALSPSFRQVPVTPGDAP